MDTGGIWFGVLATLVVQGIGVYIWIRNPDWLVQLKKLLQPAPPPPPPAPPAPPPPPPPAPVYPAPEGNVAEIPAEVYGPLPDLSQLHVFPDRLPPKTRFEELNWRLFVYRTGGSTAWPNTTTDDFPTSIQFADDNAIWNQIDARLRRGFPVILDRAGWWAASSQLLELDPEEDNFVLRAYFQIPADQRPVVVSHHTLHKDSKSGPRYPLTFLRYGFRPFFMEDRHLDPFHEEALLYTLRAFVGTTADWKWFSVARMRQDVIRNNKKAAELAEMAERLETEKKRIAHENRFTALWDTVVRPNPNMLPAPAQDSEKAENT